LIRPSCFPTSSRDLRGRAAARDPRRFMTPRAPK
jgi:hypothetical protein